MTTSAILQAQPGPYHSAPGRVISWDSYDVINYPTAEAAPKGFHDIVYDPRKRDTWMMRKQLKPSDLQSLQINDAKARITPAVRHRFGTEDRFDEKPANLMFDSFLAFLVAVWLIYVIIKVLERLDAVHPSILDENVEIEARFGKRLGGDVPFAAGVSMEQFEKIDNALSKSADWESSQAWRESEDRFFTVDGRRLRSTTVYNDDKGDGVVMATFVVEKEPVSNTILTCGSLLNTAVKISFATETAVNPDDLPSNVVPDYVRIKQRKSWVYGSSSIPGLKFQFDLTRVWRGQSHEEAEMKQKMGKTIYEVEVEILGGPFGNSVQALPAIHSLIHKVRDVVQMLDGRKLDVAQFVAER